jgi:redox-sensing transcriptional repressor
MSDNARENNKGAMPRGKRAAIPRTTLQRLPFYLRALYSLEEEGWEIVSSTQIAELVGSNSAQTRKDLSFIGEFGQRGVGYNVPKLIQELEKFLGVTRKRKVVLIGVGRLGSAILLYKGIRQRGFEIVAAFDVDPEKIGTEVGGVPVYDFNKFEEVIGNEKIDIAMITVPASEAQKVVDRIVQAGVRSILNFVPTPLKVPKGIPHRTVCLSAELQILSYLLKSAKPRIAGRRRRDRAVASERS